MSGAESVTTGHELNLNAAGSPSMQRRSGCGETLAAADSHPSGAQKNFLRNDEPLPATPSYIRPQPAGEGHRPRKTPVKRSTVMTIFMRSEEHTSELQSLTNLVC